MDRKYLNNTVLKNKLKIFENTIFVDFIKKSVIFLAFIYLGLFALESILPGIVIEVFNFNLLLFAIVGMVSFVLYADDKEKGVDQKTLKEKKHYALMFFLSLTFVFTMFVVLYKVSIIETGIYIIACLFLMKPFKNLFE